MECGSKQISGNVIDAVNIGILGAGTWGTALSKLLCNNHHCVTVWSALADEVALLSKSRRHPNLPDIVIPDGIVFTSSIKEACEDKKIVIIVVPSVYVRSTAVKMAPYLSDGQILVVATKGIENMTLMTMTDVVADVINSIRQELSLPIVALSGPTHAEEVAAELPTTIVSACRDLRIAEYVQNVFMNDFMRVYTNPDIYGVELCGALKNIVAIAAGIVSGLGYGDNAKAALITRGLAEITALGKAMGYLEQTFSGLAGLGDLIVTATSVHSRNNKAGFYIGQGMEPSKAIKKVGMVVEGINTLPSAMKLAAKYGIEMPIVSAVNSIVLNNVAPELVVRDLMNRGKRNEINKTEEDLIFETMFKKSIRGTGMKRVITYGTFDLLHYGHINLLKRAKALGDYLVVVVSSDEFNWNEKKKKSYFTYEQRKMLVEALRYVDLVIPETSWEQKRSDIHEYHIDTFVMGDDWKGKFDYLKEEGVEVVYLPRTPEISTTQIKRNLNCKEQKIN